MQPTPEQRKQIEEALLDGFDEGELTRLLSLEMGVTLNHVAGGGNLAEKVHNLVGWAQRNGRLTELIAAAYRTNPQNGKIVALAAVSATWDQSTESLSPASAQPSSVPLDEPETVQPGEAVVPSAADERVAEQDQDQRQPWWRYGIWFYAGTLIVLTLFYFGRDAIGCYYQGITGESQGKIELLKLVVGFLVFLLGALGIIAWLQRGRLQEWLFLLLGFVVPVALFMLVNVGEEAVGYDGSLCRSVASPTATPLTTVSPAATATPVGICAGDGRQCVLVADFYPADDPQASEIAHRVLTELAAGDLLPDNIWDVNTTDVITGSDQVRQLMIEGGAGIIVWGEVYQGLEELAVRFELANQLGIDQSNQLRPYRIHYFDPVAPELSCAGDCFASDNLRQAINQLGEVVAHMAAGLLKYGLGQAEAADHDFTAALYCIGEQVGTENLNLANVDCDPDLTIEHFHTGSLYYYAGRARLHTGDYASALDFLQKAEMQSPDDPAPQIGIADAYRGWLNGDESPEYQQALIEARDLAEAQRANRVLNSAPPAEVAAVDYNLGFIAEQQADWDEAIQRYGLAVDGLGPDNPQSYVAQIALGRVQGKAGRIEDAVETLRAAHELDPSTPWALLERALVQKENRSAAEPLLAAAAGIPPVQPYVDIVTAELCAKWEDFACAEAAYERALALRPDSGWLHGKVGDFYRLDEEALDKAVKHYAEAVERRPNDPWARERLGHAAYAAGEPATAADHLVRSLDLSHPSSQVAGRYCTLGQAQQAAGRFEQALESYQTCLDKGLDPELRPAVEALIEDIRK